MKKRQISQELVRLLHKAVALSNPTSLHALDERRFYEFFDAVSESGIDPSHALIDDCWPEKGIEGLGGDPAKSDYVQDRAYGLLDNWKKKIRGVTP